MLTSVTVSVLADVIESLLSGGNNINKGQVSLFQFMVGLVSLGIFLIMKFMSRNVSSPTVKAEILGWKIDVAYSIGMSGAFFIATQLKNTPFDFLAPYFDQLVAIFIMILMIPESIKMLMETFRELFLFSPDKKTVGRIKELSSGILKDFSFHPVFYDIARTGRQLWVAIYFRINSDSLNVCQLHEATNRLNQILSGEFTDISCELILDSREG